MYGRVRLFNGCFTVVYGREQSGTVGFGRLRSCTVVLRSGTVMYGSFTVGYGLERFGTVRYGSVRKRYFMHAAAVK